MALPPAPNNELTRGRITKRNPSWVYASPLAIAFLPLVLQVFKKQPVIRDRLFYAGCAVGVVHGFLMITSSYSYKVEDDE